MQIRPMEISEAEEVRALWNEACIKAVGHPLSEQNLNQLLSNLRQYAQHDTHHCLVVEDKGAIVAYVTYGVSGHPIEPGLLGEVEELYAQADYHQQKAALVQQAVIMMKQAGAGIIRVNVAVDEPDDIAFWKSLNWEQDTINFNIYGNVPEDPVSQAVWDSYQA